MKICARCGFDHDRIRQQIADKARRNLPTAIGLCDTIDRIELERAGMRIELADYVRTVKRLRDRAGRMEAVLREIGDLNSHEALEGPARARHFLKWEK